MTEQDGFWPDGARLAVSVSMQFEAGGQPVSGAGGPITEQILPGFPDLGQNSFYEYGARESVPRILDLLDAHRIKMTSFMIGDAVRPHPVVAAEIVRRGHGAGAHGRSWQRQSQLPGLQERQWIADSMRAIEQATGARPVGYNNYWIRPGVNTWRSWPGSRTTSTTCPQTSRSCRRSTGSRSRLCRIRCTSTTSPASTSPASTRPAYAQQLTDEFDQLYAEGARRRRKMVIGLHERISGHASWVRVLDRVFTRLRCHEDVWWARNDQIARWLLDHPGTAAWVDRDPPVSSLPGRG